MMGAGLVKAAYAVAARLGIREHAPVRAYVYMALIALDRDPEPSYYGGREALADALALAPTASRYRSLERTISALVNAGLVATLSPAATGKPARYGLRDGAGNPLSVTQETPGAERHPLPEEQDVTPGTERPPLPVDNYVTPGAERRNARHSEAERPALSTGPKEERRNKEERGGETPPLPLPRSCKKHASWDHGQLCRACGNDRRAAEAAETEAATAARRPAPRMARHQHTFHDVSGWCDCGLRDTGEIQPYTPAARGEVDTHTTQTASAAHHPAARIPSTGTVTAPPPADDVAQDHTGAVLTARADDALTAYPAAGTPRPTAMRLSA